MPARTPHKRPTIRVSGRGGARAPRAGYRDDNGWWGIGYDAVHNKGRRAQIQGRVLSEDLELRDLSRRQLTTNTRDLNRNFSVAAWAIRRHLDFVSTFHFRSATGDKRLDQDIENLMEWWSRKENCDPAGRHSLQRLMRMWEMRRTVDGDVLINRLKDGRIQTIEGDRIQSFGGIPFQELGITDSRYVINGVWVDLNGRARKYMVFKRQPGWTGLIWDRAVPARFSELFGYYDRYDQVRGVSPLAAAVNTFRDVYEGLDYALVKAKVSQLLGLIVTRKESDELGVQEEKEGEADPHADPDKPRYDVDLGRGPLMLDMDPGDDAKIIESQQPSTQFQAFEQICIMIALKALDIPFSFFDESHTNYSGARLAGVQYYDGAVKIKQADLRSLLMKHTAWRIGLWIADGWLKLPEGMQPWQLRYEWSHAGIPLFDPQKEVSADIAAVNAGFASPQEVCKARGKDFFRLIDDIAAARQYAASKGVILSTALVSTAADDPNKAQTVKEDQQEDKDAEEEEGGKSGSKSRVFSPQ